MKKRYLVWSVAGLLGFSSIGSAYFYQHGRPASHPPSGGHAGGSFGGGGRPAAISRPAPIQRPNFAPRAAAPNVRQTVRPSLTPTVRPNVNNGAVNRSNTVINRSANVNRPIIGNTVNRSTTINNINNNVIRNNVRPNYALNRPYVGWSQPGNWGGYYPGWHSGWHSGYWGGGWLNNAGWFAAGAATGWLLSPYVASYSYYNPFYVAPTVIVPGTVVYNYAQPIAVAPATQVTSPTDIPLNVTINPTINVTQPGTTSTSLSPPAPDVSKMSEQDAAALQAKVEAIVAEGREAFKKFDFKTAQAKAEEAIAKLPNDPSLHEFRALTLFAQKKYKEASAAIYSVLASGPGWNWDTLKGFYSFTQTYTKQLRDLEDHFKANPTASEDAFLLAYEYLTLGETESAIKMLEKFHALVPSDELSKKLIQLLKAPPKPADDGDKPRPGG